MGSASRRFDGFFNSEFRVNEVVGRSVSYVRDGKLLGGNPGFAHIGSYSFEGDNVAVEVTSPLAGKRSIRFEAVLTLICWV